MFYLICIALSVCFYASGHYLSSRVGRGKYAFSFGWYAGITFSLACVIIGKA